MISLSGITDLSRRIYGWFIDWLLSDSGRVTHRSNHVISTGTALYTCCGILLSAKQHIAKHRIANFFVLQKCAGLFHEINRAHDAAMHMQLILGCGGKASPKASPNQCLRELALSKACPQRMASAFLMPFLSSLGWR